MTLKQNLNNILTQIFSTLSITFTDDDGISLPVKLEKLENIAPAHPKVIDRIYLEFMQSDGSPYYHILGAITEPINPDEVLGMDLFGEFTSNNIIQQIWLNKETKQNVRVILPSLSPPSFAID